jgi:hypothetical protein
LTIRKYADTKFEYLSYCLKVKEMDDQECTFGVLQDPLYRVETGNYYYRYWNAQRTTVLDSKYTIMC